MSEYTDDQILAGMTAALKARDNEAVVSLLRLLALQAPAKAQQIYDAISKGTVTIEVPIR